MKKFETMIGKRLLLGSAAELKEKPAYTLLPGYLPYCLPRTRSLAALMALLLWPDARRIGIGGKGGGIIRVFEW